MLPRNQNQNKTLQTPGTHDLGFPKSSHESLGDWGAWLLKESRLEPDKIENGKKLLVSPAIFVPECQSSRSCRQGLLSLARILIVCTLFEGTPRKGKPKGNLHIVGPPILTHTHTCIGLHLNLPLSEGPTAKKLKFPNRQFGRGFHLIVREPSGADPSPRPMDRSVSGPPTRAKMSDKTPGTDK